MSSCLSCCPAIYTTSFIMTVTQGLLKGSSLKQGCVSHQQTRVPGRLTCSRRSPSSRLSLNARTQTPAPQQLTSSARSCRRQLKQRKQSCSCPLFSACGCRHQTVCGAGTAHPEEASIYWQPLCIKTVFLAVGVAQWRPVLSIVLYSFVCCFQEH